jgi:hypothetical protein
MDLLEIGVEELLQFSFFVLFHLTSQGSFLPLAIVSN